MLSFFSVIVIHVRVIVLDSIQKRIQWTVVHIWARCLTRWACVKGERPWWHLVVQVNIVATLKLVFFSEHLLGNIIIRVQRIFTRNKSRRIHFFSIPCITRRNFRRIFMKDLLSAKDKDKAVKSMYSVLLLSSSSIKM